jgi:alpha-tubulin suppressor-like RCC1 family protein
VRCWGGASYGELGYGNIDNIGDDETPESAGNVNVGGNVVQIATGAYHSCALLDTGAVRCWGSGSSGQLGYGNTDNIGDDETPASVGDVNIGGRAVQVSAGAMHTCALLETGAVRCWGDAGGGALGYGNENDIGDNAAPASAVDVNIGGNAVQISLVFSHTCALLDTGAVRCWGNGWNGKLGYGETRNIGDNETPASAGDVNLGEATLQLTVGTYHTCALLESGTVHCWGEGESGKLGYGNINNIGDDEDPVSAGEVVVGYSTMAP